jgi:hypothetical protein
VDIKLLSVYFVIGRVIVCAVTYLGSQAKGQLAAFVTFLPSISVTILQ